MFNIHFYKQSYADSATPWFCQETKAYDLQTSTSETSENKTYLPRNLHRYHPIPSSFAFLHCCNNSSIQLLTAKSLNISNARLKSKVESLEVSLWHS